ncbi:zinc metalloproteinase nas-13-like [Maniola hyperantus]|uniref:zinc metalloproteinase nas-13-like n=1 Tax=Aphantopus hyperantus TaxID=2795564 RepID=UPI00156A45F2|nr:astacin-like metalloprotease toxin 2 [Maniola hyperantus]
MLFVSELLVLFTIFVYFAFASLDPPVQPLIDGSKFAFIRAPYVNTVKIQKDLALEDDVSFRWPSGIVRYYVDNRSYDIVFEILIRSPIQIIQMSSCIEFISLKEKPSDNKAWLHITNPNKERECNHEPRFKDTGEIELVFGYDCLKNKEMLHTLLHGIGIRDEVTHPHRDKYIGVLWDNIHPAYQHLYRKQTEKTSKTLVEYDPLSVMHFHDRAFSRNGHATIAPLEPGLLISPSDTLSQLDKMRLQMYFGHECNKRKVSNLLNTCKKSLGEKGRGQTGENGGQDTDSDDVAQNNNKTAEGQSTEEKHEEEPAINGQDSDKEDAGNEDGEGINNKSTVVEVDKDNEEARKGTNEDTGNEDGETINSKNTVVEVDEDNEVATKGTNEDTENSGKLKSVKKKLTESAYENDTIERLMSEKKNETCK